MAFNIAGATGALQQGFKQGNLNSSEIGKDLEQIHAQVQKLGKAQGPQGVATPKAANVAATQGVRFESLLSNGLQSVDATQKIAQQDVSDVLTGKVSNTHQAMISMKYAEESFNLAIEVRNKVMETHDTLMRLQV